jgi:hypothetical protein
MDLKNKIPNNNSYSSFKLKDSEMAIKITQIQIKLVRVQLRDDHTLRKI